MHCFAWSRQIRRIIRGVDDGPKGPHFDGLKSPILHGRATRSTSGALYAERVDLVERRVDAVLRSEDGDLERTLVALRSSSQGDGRSIRTSRGGTTLVVVAAVDEQSRRVFSGGGQGHKDKAGSLGWTASALVTATAFDPSAGEMSCTSPTARGYPMRQDHSEGDASLQKKTPDEGVRAGRGEDLSNRRKRGPLRPAMTRRRFLGLHPLSPPLDGAARVFARFSAWRLLSMPRRSSRERPARDLRIF